MKQIQKGRQLKNHSIWSSGLYDSHWAAGRRSDKSTEENGKAPPKYHPLLFDKDGKHHSKGQSPQKLIMEQMNNKKSIVVHPNLTFKP